MDKRQQIVRDLEEELVNVDVSDVFDRLDKYHMEPPSVEATNQLVQTLKPMFIQQKVAGRQQQRFRDIVASTRQSNAVPAILQLIGTQTTLMSKGFVLLTIAFLMAGLLLANLFQSDSSSLLIIASPFLGLLTLSYEYRAQMYMVEEIEASCCYSPAQVATARILVVLSYNVILCTVATVTIEPTYNIVFWNLMLNWLAPLLLMLGVALFTSLKFGITSGCIMAGALWVAQITLVNGESFLHFLLPSLSTVFIDLISILLGIGLLYFSLSSWKAEERQFQVR